MLKLLTGLRSRVATKQGLSTASKLPYQPMRFSFDSMSEYDSFRARFPKVFEQVWHWQMRFGDRAAAFTFTGICEICDSLTEFRAEPRDSGKAKFANRVNWWLSAACSRCGLVMRDRVVARHLIDRTTEDALVYYVGHHSRIRTWIQERRPRGTIAQFGRGKKSDSQAGSLPLDDLTLKTGVRDGSLDAIVVIQVLENVPDHRQALSEIARRLKAGGHALITVPWAGEGQQDHTLRAQMDADGSARHLLPPMYHVDTVTGEKFLRYRAFGWSLLDELRRAGFTRATTEYLFAPVHGYIGLSPFILATK